MEDKLETLIGAENIGRYIGCTTRQTFHLLETGQLPATKLGNKWVSTKPKLRQRIEGSAA